MPNDLIRYDLLVQEALCGVVKKVLGEAARHGLPGEHHFYITFRTHAQGVRLSSRMREMYPEEMTIILQHQFEDLKVTDHAFEVGLSFKGIPEILLIPFDALTGFFDPSVQFSAKFEPQVDLEDMPNEAPTGPSLVSPLTGPRALPSPQPLASVPKVGAPSRPVRPVASKPSLETVPAEPEGNDEAGQSSTDQPKVVSIDAFRKKP